MSIHLEKLYFNCHLSKTFSLKIQNFISELISNYNLHDKKFEIHFRNIYSFGDCAPKFFGRKIGAKIIINSDLLNEELFEELKGVLAHEFAHFYHYVNFSKIDFCKFAFKGGTYAYISGKFFKNFMVKYEKFTELTTIAFGYEKEILKLRKYTPIYRENLPLSKVPDMSNYYTLEDLKKLENYNYFKLLLRKNYNQLKLVTLPFDEIISEFKINKS